MVDLQNKTPRGSPPSTYAVVAVLEGEPDGWKRVAVATGQRALLLLPGIWLAGVRGYKLPLAAALGSIGITGALFISYGLKLIPAR